MQMPNLIIPQLGEGPLTWKTNNTSLHLSSTSPPPLPPQFHIFLVSSLYTCAVNYMSGTFQHSFSTPWWTTFEIRKMHQCFACHMASRTVDKLKSWGRFSHLTHVSLKWKPTENILKSFNSDSDKSSFRKCHRIKKSKSVIGEPRNNQTEKQVIKTDNHIYFIFEAKHTVIE